MNFLASFKYFFRYLNGCILILVLQSCGVSTDSGTPDDLPTFVNAFTVTSNNISSTPVPIDFAAANSVLFNFSWEVSSSDPYFVTVYMSDDTTPDLFDDVILDTTCGSLDDYICEVSYEQECGISYEPDLLLDHYYVRCNHGPATVSSADIVDRLQTAGFPAASLLNYLLLSVCNEAGDSCVTVFRQIQIMDSVP